MNRRGYGAMEVVMCCCVQCLAIAAAGAHAPQAVSAPELREVNATEPARGMVSLAARLLRAVLVRVRWWP